MKLTRKQEEAVKICVDRYRAREKYSVISGYAGSGKSTSVRFIIEALGIDESKVCYTAYTGKAAQVLYRKGNKNVKTLHKLLYKSKPLPNGKFIRVPVESIPYKLIIVDEVSMPDIDMMKLLFSYDVHVICCGDPFQLPPINKEKDNHLLDNPHVFLDEIMRQAQESEIIRVTMDIRAGRSLKPMKGKEVIIINKKDLNTGMLGWADQVICATNKTRHELNNVIRQRIRGIESENPVDGDKLICLRNYWEEDFGCEEPLINGTIGYLRNSFKSFNKIPKYIGGGEIPLICGEIESDRSIFHGLSMDKNIITKEEKTLSSKQEYVLAQNWKTKDLIPLEFTYGYVVTCHKAQGSSWGNVLVIEENFPFDREEHARWLYTSCTRSVDKLVLVRKD